MRWEENPESMRAIEARRNKVVKGEGGNQMKTNKNRGDHWFMEPMEVTGDP